MPICTPAWATFKVFTNWLKALTKLKKAPMHLTSQGIYTPFYLVAVIIIDHMYNYSPINTHVQLLTNKHSSNLSTSHRHTLPSLPCSPAKLLNANVIVGALATQVNGEDCSHCHCIATHDCVVNSIVAALLMMFLAKST